MDIASIVCYTHNAICFSPTPNFILCQLCVCNFEHSCVCKFEHSCVSKFEHSCVCKFEHFCVCNLEKNAQWPTHWSAFPRKLWSLTTRVSAESSCFMRTYSLCNFETTRIVININAMMALCSRKAGYRSKEVNEQYTSRSNCNNYGLINYINI